MTTTDIAKIAYEALRAYNQQVFGDFSQKSWDHVEPERQREMEERVKFSLHYGPRMPASAYHDRWLAARLWEGWTVADYTDSKQKKHSRLLPWSLLPKAEQERDRFFAQICACLGVEVEQAQAVKQ